MTFVYRNPPVDLRHVVIEAERVRLIAITPEYTDEIYRHFTPEITRYMMPAPARELADTEVFMKAALAGLRSDEELHLVICRKSNDEFLGICGLHGRGQPMQPELGIWLKKAAHGNGFGLEAISALTKWAGTCIEFEHLLYPVDRRNIASRKIPEALGGRVLEECKKQSMTGAVLDEVIYGIERTDPA